MGPSPFNGGKGVDGLSMGMAIKTEELKENYCIVSLRNENKSNLSPAFPSPGVVSHV